MAHGTVVVFIQKVLAVNTVFLSYYNYGRWTHLASGLSTVYAICTRQKMYTVKATTYHSNNKYTVKTSMKIFFQVIIQTVQ